MLSEKMEKAINLQINREMYSAYLYMAMAAHAQRIGLKGFSNWFMVQYHEEMVHAMKMYEFILARGGTISLQAIEQPPSSWKRPREMFEKTLEHEQFVTRCIHELLELARSEKDYASEVFLQWYVNEQVEEENNASEILTQLGLAGDSPQALMVVDTQLGTRVTTVPTDFSKGVEKQMQAGG